MPDKRKNKKNVRVSDFTKEVLKLAAKDMDMSEVKVVEMIVSNTFPTFVLQVKRKALTKESK